MTRLLSLRKNILMILERCEPYALPERQLKLELDGSIRPPAALAEFEDALSFLNIRKHILTVPDPLDEQNVKWTITETGKAMLRQ
jgi:hypothetical protein